MSEPRSVQIVGFVNGKVAQLQAEYARGGAAPTSWASSQLARLRRGSPLSVGDDPSTWGTIMEAMPNDLIGGADAPSRAEVATNSALILYSHHQQGRNEPMHVPSQGFGHAVRVLSQRRSDDPKKPDPGALRRFEYLCSSGAEAMRWTHFRSLVSMMRGSKVPLGYGLLARDIYLLAAPDRRQTVLLRWAREYHANPASDPKNPDTDKPAQEDS